MDIDTDTEGSRVAIYEDVGPENARTRRSTSKLGITARLKPLVVGRSYEQPPTRGVQISRQPQPRPSTWPSAAIHLVWVSGWRGAMYTIPSSTLGGLNRHLPPREQKPLPTVASEDYTWVFSAILLGGIQAPFRGCGRLFVSAGRS